MSYLHQNEAIYPHFAEARVTEQHLAVNTLQSSVQQHGQHGPHGQPRHFGCKVHVALPGHRESRENGDQMATIDTHLQVPLACPDHSICIYI